MDPKNHPIEKENQWKSSFNPPFLGFKMLIFQGVDTIWLATKKSKRWLVSVPTQDPIILLDMVDKFQ